MPSRGRAPGRSPLSRLASRAGFLSIGLRLARRDTILIVPPLLAAAGHLSLPPAGGALIGALFSVLVPISIGYALLGLATRLPARRAVTGGLVGLGLSWTVGAWSLLAISALGSQAGLFSVGRLAGVAIWGPVGAWVLLRLADRWRPMEPIPSPAAGALSVDTAPASERAAASSTRERGTALGAVAVALFGGAFAAWYRLDSPPPFQPAWDVLVHVRVVDRLLGQFFSLWTTDYSTAFHLNAYFPTQQLTVALATQATGQPPLAVYWAGPFVVIPALCVLAYALARLSGARPLAAVLAGGAVAIIGFPLPSLGLMGLLPRTLAALFFPLILAAATDPAGTVRGRLTRVTALGLGAFALHWLVGFVAFALGGVVVLLTVVERRRSGIWALAVVAVAAVIALASLLYLRIVQLPADPFYTLIDTERQVVQIQSLAERGRSFTSQLAWVAVAGSGIGAVLLALRGRRSGQASASLAFCWVAALVVAFAPLPGAERVLAMLPAAFVAPFGWLFEHALRWAERIGARPAERGLLVGVGFALAGILTAQPLLRLYESQVSRARDAGMLSSFAAVEVRAAQMIRDDTPRGTLIVSDPVTQEVIGGLANREAYGGGPYASDAQLTELYDALTARTAREQWEGLWRAVKSDGWRRGPVVFVFSGRTASWLVNPDRSWVGYYQRLGPYLRDEKYTVVTKALARLRDERYFVRLLRYPGELEVFALKPLEGDSIRQVEPVATGRAAAQLWDMLNIRGEPTGGMN